MNKRLGISLAVLAAIAVVSIGVAGFACGDRNSSDNSGVVNSFAPGGTGCSVKGCNASACPYMRRMCEEANIASFTACNHSCSNCCHGANVFDVSHGHQYAVCKGDVFEVTNATPYVEIGDSRYYVADKCMEKEFQSHPMETARESDHEAVSLATADGNIVGEHHGQKVAKCPVTGQVFIVTADSPVRVFDGKCYYMSDTVNLSTVDSRYP